MVAGPGTGKSFAISYIEEFWRALGKTEEMFVAPSSVSSASIVDAINDAKKKIANPAREYQEYNALAICASEFGVFFTEYEGRFITALCKFYDGEYFDEQKRSLKNKEKIIIENPLLNLLAGTTPASLRRLLPESAWDEGLASRTLFVFSDERTIVDPFLTVETDNELRHNLIYDLHKIALIDGLIQWTPEAVLSFRKWHLSGGQPVPQHPKLVNYIPRRSIHLAKLCMIMSVSRADGDKAITFEDYSNALSLLIETEELMPDIFKAMSISGGDSAPIDELHSQIIRYYMKKKAPMPESQVIEFLTRRVTPHSVLRVIENMVKSGMIKPIYHDGRTYYEPISVKD